MRPLIGRAVRRMALAMTSLTTLPIPVQGVVEESDLAASRWAYPIVGLILGSLLGALSWSLDRIGAPPSIASVLLVAAWAILTGGLHLDGLADSADGLFLGGGPGRRLDVMRDPHVGSFGVVGLVLLLLGKYSALAAIAGPRRIGAVLLAAIAGRSLILVAAGVSRYARPDGTGRVVINATGSSGCIFGASVALLAGLLAAGPPGVLAALAAILLTLALIRFAMIRIVGITGDVLGAVVELGEWMILVGLGMGWGS